MAKSSPATRLSSTLSRLMKNLPLDLIRTLESVESNFKLSTVLHEELGTETITFRTLGKISQTLLYVNVDVYIDNYSDDSTDLAGNYYPVEAFDLLSDFPRYHAFGILVWIPQLSEYATYDEDHCVLRSFPNSTFSDILENPKRFFNCLWYPDEYENHLIRPWNDERFGTIVPTKQPDW